MDKVKLIALIVALYAIDIDARADVVKKTAEENNLKVGDLFKSLKEVGYDPKAPKGSAAPELKDNSAPQTQHTGPTKKVILRHKTQYPKYRRAGIVLSQKAMEYEVTEEQLAILEKDVWVVVGEDKKDGNGK